MKSTGHSDVPVLDAEVLSALWALGDDDPGFVEQVVELFTRDSPGRVGELQAALAASASAPAAAAVHTIKGSCAAIGARRMVVVCEEIEAGIASGDLAGAADGAVQLDVEYLVATQELVAQLDGHARGQ